MGHVHLPRLVLSFVLCLQFFMGTSAQAQQYLPEQFEVDRSFSELTDAEKKYIDETFKVPTVIGFEVLTLVELLRRKVDEAIAREGEEAVAKRITSRKKSAEIFVEIPGVGKAELASIGLNENGRIFTRVVHYGSRNAHLFFDSQLFDFNYLNQDEKFSKQDKKIRKELGKQLEYYVARQLVFSGMSNPEYVPFELTQGNKQKYEEIKATAAEEITKLDGVVRDQMDVALEYAAKEKLAESDVAGRDIYVHYYNSGKILPADVKEKHDSKMSLQFWKDYFKGIYEVPNRRDVNLAIYAGGAQGIISYFLGGPTVAFLSVVFGVTLGIYAKTYVNWKYVESSVLVRTMKQWSISMLFAYTLTVMDHGWAAIVGLSTAVLMEHLHIISNNLANNLAKVYFEEIPRLRNKNGDNLGVIKFFRSIEMDRHTFESQTLYLLLFGFKILDLVSEATIRVPGLGELKLGKIALWSTIPIMHYVTVLFAEKQKYAEAAALRQSWENSKAFMIPYLGLIHDGIQFAINKALKPVGIEYKAKIFNSADRIVTNTIKSFRTQETTAPLCSQIF